MDDKKHSHKPEVAQGVVWRPIYANQRFQICESRGSMHWVEWIEIELFCAGKEILFPPYRVKQI